MNTKRFTEGTRGKKQGQFPIGQEEASLLFRRSATQRGLASREGHPPPAPAPYLAPILHMPIRV